MSRPQRRQGRTRAVSPKRYESEGTVKGGKAVKEVEEVYSNKSKPRKNNLMVDKHKSNRCTYFRPSITDFSQLTEFEKPTDNYQNILREQFGLEPSEPVPDRDEKLRELTKLLRKNTKTVENGSQCAEPTSKSQIHINHMDDMQELHWQTIDNTAELDRYIRILRDAEVQSVALEKPKAPRVRISEVPRITVIAEKFSKFKRNNIELRRLEEKVVCLEYDVFNKDSDDAKPFQKMRAFFTMKPRKVEDVDETIIIPPEVKRNFNIEDADFDQLDKKEIEIIDGKIPDNRSLLEDLKKVLRRKQAIEHKKKQNTLDLEYLYQMARRESPPLDEDYSNTNILSKAELDEIRDLILKKCASSVHGIRRRTVNSELGDSISNCLAAELMGEDKESL